jgi:hypothetical protein
MKVSAIKMAVGNLACLLLLAALGVGQDTNPIQNNAGQATQPGGVSSGTTNASTPSATSTPPAPIPSATQGNNAAGTVGSVGSKASASRTNSAASANATNGDDNPYDPFLEPPPLPKGKPTLIGGIATRVDHVRNRLTVTPFGKGQKVNLFVDERTHIYRNGTETTVLGIHKGDRVYVDTMLDGSRVFAKNVRVLTDMGMAEVRGQVMGRDPDRGTISVRDQLSARPVTFTVNGATKYTSMKGEASAADVQVGSLIDVQFYPDRGNRDLAQEITVFAKPGDNYVFSGVVTSVDMRTNTVAVSNRSDEQTYDLHFDPAQLNEPRALKVGSEVTARAVFDGKQYKTSNLRIESSEAESEKTEVQ